MNILILTQYYVPEMGGASARLHGISRWLASYGHNVTVITGFPNYPAGIIFDGYKNEIFTKEKIDNVEVLRTWIYASEKKSITRRMASYLSFVCSSIIGGMLGGAKYDVIIASSPPLFIGISGLLLSRALGAPLIFDIRDIWPEVAVEAGELDQFSKMVLWGEKLENLIYRESDHITVVTEAKREKLLAKGIANEKISVVQNGVDLDLIRPSNDNKTRKDLGMEGKFLVVYTGLIGIFQGVEMLVDAAEQLREREEFHFLVVGDGVRRIKMTEMARRKGLKNITFMGTRPREEIPEIIGASDVAFVPLSKSKLADAVPSKVFEAWGCKKPVLMVADGEARRMVEESGGGVVMSPDNPQELATHIMKLAEDHERLEEYATLGYRYVEKRLDRSKLAKTMEGVIIDTVGKYDKENHIHGNGRQEISIL